ncbi:MAG TPA: enoyl-CoA hydratase-related protein, partial [Solirubrobacteraceae bacterium]|nr:enoyl-CoA hydratase-related protein [Solirubrobacteraceae bacterium]
MGETVMYESAAGVATLTLNRPQRLNTITPELIEDLHTALSRAWEERDVRAIRLRGAGRAFCAGYD